LQNLTTNDKKGFTFRVFTLNVPKNRVITLNEVTMKKKILVILGHPSKESLNGALANAYYEGAKGNAEVKILNLGDIRFDPILWDGYNKRQELEPDLIEAQELIKWANHLVIFYPTWWSTIPALLKGFFDRILLPDFAFSFSSSKKNSPHKKLLKGRTAHLITTMDTPSWYYRCIMKQPGFVQLKKGILGFVGIKVVRISSFIQPSFSTKEKRNKWLTKALNLGKLNA